VTPITRARRHAITAALLLALCLLIARPALAHPMGNFSVNHYSKLTIDKDGITVRYFIDLAEIPTYQELQQADLTPDNTAGIARFLSTRAQELKSGLVLTIDGRALPLKLLSKDVIFPPGAGGLPTMKMGFVFRAACPNPGKHALAYADNNYPGHAGWKELVLVGPPSLLADPSAPATDRSSELSNYPTDMLNTPPQVLSATATLTLPAAVPAIAERKPANPVPAHAALATPAAAPSSPRPAAAPAPLQQPAPAPIHLQANKQTTPRDAFTQLVTRTNLSPWFLVSAAFIAFGLGALHALEPGHGKTIVAAYLVGSRGTARHAALLGVIVTASHTAGVFALGGITLYLARYILPEQLYPWLGVLSGLTIAVLGAYLLLRRWTGLAVDHSHAPGAGHSHWFAWKKRPDPGLNLLGESPEVFDNAPEPAASAALAARDQGRPISLAQLFILGVTGGIIPCPAALVVLLSAFSLHRIGFGFFLIVAFSLGLAAVLITFGMLMVYARRFMGRLTVDGPLTRRWLPIASSAFITILGIAIAVRALATTGFSLHDFTPERIGPALFVAGIGLFLGMKHSTDPDHVVAVSTIVTRQQSSGGSGIRGAAAIGALWGLGHTITIFVVGAAIILFGVVIPPRLGLSMEFSVALMLILLGVLNLTGVMQRVTARFSRAPANSATMRPGPFFRTIGRYGWFQTLRPLFIGLVHGLAGSAAVALLVLSTIHSPLWAILYLLVFGAGTLLGMMCMTAAMAVPLAYAGNRFTQVSHYLGVASGLVSVCFGIFLVYQLGYLGGLFTSHPHWTPE
jgi:nickel/cobalt exporter